jgi:hypothetical protein
MSVPASEFIDLPTVGEQLLCARSSKTAQRFGKKHGLAVFLINGRRHFRRADVLAAIESSRVVITPTPAPSSLKSMLNRISDDVLSRRKAAL